MTELPPPRPPDAPPIGPPIRRPEDHLPRPESFPGPAPATPAPPKRRLALLVLALAGLGIAIAVRSYALASRGDDDTFDTEAAAATLDTVLGDEPPPTSCPVDDVDDLLARAFDDVDDDAVYDTIDLGTQGVSVSERDQADSVSCDLVLLTPSNTLVSLALSPDPGQYLDGIEEAAPGLELERVDGAHGGTVVRATSSGGGVVPDGALATWANDDVAIGVSAFGPLDDVELDDLQTGLEDVLVDVVDELAADGSGD